MRFWLLWISITLDLSSLLQTFTFSVWVIVLPASCRYLAHGPWSRYRFGTEQICCFNGFTTLRPDTKSRFLSTHSGCCERCLGFRRGDPGIWLLLYRHGWKESWHWCDNLRANDMQKSAIKIQPFGATQADATRGCEEMSAIWPAGREWRCWQSYGARICFGSFQEQYLPFISDCQLHSQLSKVDATVQLTFDACLGMAFRPLADRMLYFAWIAWGLW